MAEAPRDQTTGLSAPLSNAPTPAPVAQTTPEISKRDEISAQNKAQMALNKQQADLRNQERKQTAEEARIASIPTDQKSIVQALASGVNVPVQNTPEYRNAQTIYKNFRKYNAMTDTELLTNLKQGNVGTEMDSLLMQNPNYAKAKAEYARVQKTDSLNRMGQSLMNVVTGKE